MATKSTTKKSPLNELTVKRAKVVRTKAALSVTGTPVVLIHLDDTLAGLDATEAMWFGQHIIAQAQKAMQMAGEKMLNSMLIDACEQCPDKNTCPERGKLPGHAAKRS